MLLEAATPVVTVEVPPVPVEALDVNVDEPTPTMGELVVTTEFADVEALGELTLTGGDAAAPLVLIVEEAPGPVLLMLVLDWPDTGVALVIGTDGVLAPPPLVRVVPMVLPPGGPPVLGLPPSVVVEVTTAVLRLPLLVVVEVNTPVLRLPPLVVVEVRTRVISTF